MWKNPTSLSSLIVVVIVTNCVICWSHVEAIKHFQPPSSGEKSSLHQDLCDFLNIIPVEDIRNLTKHFYANDKDMRGSYDYLRGEGYRKIVENLSQISIFKKFTSFLNDSGVNFAELNKKIEKFVLTSEETDSIAFVDSYGRVAGDDGKFRLKFYLKINKKIPENRCQFHINSLTTKFLAKILSLTTLLSLLIS